MTDDAQPSTPHRRPRRALAIVGTLAALGTVAGVALLASPRSSAEAPRPPDKAAAGGPDKAPPLPVQVHLARLEAYTPTVEGTGTLLPNEQVEISAELARKLVNVAVDDGQEVAAGQVLFELDTRDTLAAIARLRAQARYAKASYARYNTLSESGAVSTDERESRRAGVDDVNAQLGELEVQLDKARIVAPFSGTFGLRPVSVGAWVTPGQALGRLVDRSTMKLDFRLPERFVADVAVGAAVTFTVDGRAETFAGVVSAVDTEIDRLSRSVVVRARVAEPKGLLPGMFAKVRLALKPRDVLFVPAIAVIPSPTGARLFVERDGKAQALEVEVGVREPARVEIVKGLQPGDAVIATNLLRVRDGAKVVRVGEARAAAAP